MIHTVTMYAATCDNCGEDWEHGYNGWSCMNDKQSLMDGMDDWHIPDDVSDICYCPDCHSFNDEDELLINSERTKK